ncbi:MAG: hypothetical protein JXA79_07220 [Deltaproteobacteria bacterium]|nr:hypothetical protein [Deltaproteobacteria bacterium]
MKKGSKISKSFIIPMLLMILCLATNVLAQYSYQYPYNSDIYSNLRIGNQALLNQYSNIINYAGLFGQQINQYSNISAFWSQYPPNVSNINTNISSIYVTGFGQSMFQNFLPTGTIATGTDVQRLLTQLVPIGCILVTERAECHRHGCSTPVSCPLQPFR